MVKKITKIKLVEKYLNDYGRRYYLRELADLLKKPHQSIKPYVDELVKEGILIKNKRKNVVEYYLNFKDKRTFDYLIIAEKEKLPKIATRLKAIAIAEKHHEERYKKLLAEVEGKTVFKKSKEVEWVCRECGYAHKGKEPPNKCPSCDHEKSFYQVKCECY